MTILSKKRLTELAKRLYIKDYETQRHGFMSLELGTRVGLTTGYPELQFSQFEDVFVLDVTVPTGDSEYDTSRAITIDEMLTFVLVAKKKYPNERMTKELIKKVKTILADKKAEISIALEQVNDSLKQIEP